MSRSSLLYCPPVQDLSLEEPDAAAFPRRNYPGTQSPQASPLKAMAGVLLLLPLVLVPLVFLAFAGPQSLAEHSRLGRYRPIDAVVVATGVERRAGTASQTPAWVPRVTFEYRLGAATYQASRLTPLDRSGTQRWARREIAPYHAGDRVRAWYDPREPGRAFLERGNTPALNPTLLAPAPILALALWMAGNARAKRRGLSLPQTARPNQRVQRA